MKKQINEIKRMQQLAGLITENDNSQMPHQGKISFGPFKNVDWHKIREKISLVAIDSDNFRDIEDALDTKGRDYYTNKEIKYLNGVVEKIANEMSDYLTSIGIENKVFDSPIGYGQEIDNLVVDIDINDFDKLNESSLNESETKTFSAMQPIIDDLKAGMVTLDKLMSRDTGENSLQQMAKRQGLKGLSIKMKELWTELSKSI